MTQKWQVQGIDGGDVLDGRTFFFYLLTHAVTEDFISKHKIKEFWGKFRQSNNDHDIEFKIDGVELPLIETFDIVWKQFEHKVKEEALSLIQEQFADVQNVLTHLKDTVLTDVAKKLNVDYSPDGW
jgi:hypothetical protein